MGSQLPTAGTAIEVQGVIGSFVGVDLLGDGGVVFTVKAAQSNVRLMLEHLQAVVEQLVDRGSCNDAENSAHGGNAYLNRILSATSAGSHGFAAITADSIGGEKSA